MKIPPAVEHTSDFVFYSHGGRIGNKMLALFSHLTGGRIFSARAGAKKNENRRVKMGQRGGVNMGQKWGKKVCPLRVVSPYFTLKITKLPIWQNF